MNFVRTAWYFACWSSELGEAPMHRKILGDDIAFYRDGEGHARALGAVCPHRGANLGKGRVTDGDLACPYHGWRFGADGHCTAIPSQPVDHKIPPGARVPTYPVCEQQGVVWIWPEQGAVPKEPAPQYTVFEDERALVRMPTALLDSEFVNVVENAFDDSHVYYLHTGTLGVPTPMLPQQILEREEDGRGLSLRWDMDSAWGLDAVEQMDDTSSAMSRYMLWRYGKTDWENRRARFRMGGTILFEIPTTRGHQQHIIGCATPSDAQHTWFTTALAHPMARNPLLRPGLRSFGRVLNGEDEVGTTQLLAPASVLKPISVVADRGALGFRRLYEEMIG